MTGPREARQPKVSARQRLEDELHALAERCSLEHAHQLVRAVDLPPDLAAALLTNRVELLALARPRALTEEEAGRLYKLVAVLMETNAALREHADNVSRLAENWLSQFTGLASVGEGIVRYARFETRPLDNEEDEA
jgi:hypothetical protein